MAITQNRIEADLGGAETSFSTASISPAANKLHILTIVSIAQDTLTDPTLTANGGFSSWTRINRLPFNSIDQVLMYRAVSASPGSGVVTIDFGAAIQTLTWWAIYEFTNTVITGENAANAIVQEVNNSNSGVPGLTLTLAALGNPNNAGFATILHQSFNETGTPNSGWAQTRSFGNSEGTVSDVFAINKTDPGVTWTENTVHGGMALEIKASDEVPFIVPRWTI